MKGLVRLHKALLPAVIVAGLLASAPPAAAATTIPVTTTAPSPGLAGDCTLGEAIQAANTDLAVDACPAGSGADVVSLPTGAYTLSSVDHISADGPVALPTITGTVTFDGSNSQDTIVQRTTTPGAPAFMLFHMEVTSDRPCWPTCTVTFKDVALQSADGLGGAVTNRAGRTAFENAVLSGNTNGPAVRTGGRLSVTSSVVTNNSSTGDGGAFLSEGNATISGNTSLSNNSAGRGGALYLGASGTATISDSTFDSNSATTGGSLAGPGTWSISGSTFKNNYTTGGPGGAIGAVPGSLSVTTSYFQDNSASGQEGGAIAASGTLDVTRSTFAGNMADNGGAVAARGSVQSFRNTTFGGNSAAFSGGGLFATGGTTTISNNTFAENFAEDGGGFAWEANGGTLDLSNSLIATNGGFTAPDCATDASIASDGYNLIGDGTDCSITSGAGDQIGTSETPIDPMISPLDAHGGNTRTFSLLTGSPAIDTGNPAAPGGGGATCEQVDQRNQVRPRDGDGDDTFRCDIGAYEGGIGLPLLTVEKTGTGTGLVDTDADTIVCGSDCVESFTAGTSVVLLATPTADAEFTEWMGCDSVVGDQCTVSMNEDRTVFAKFTDVQNVLSVTRTGSGQGSVSSVPAGIDCGLDCNELYAYGAEITLTANPASNSNFHFWSGCDQTNGTTCTFTLNEDRSVFASFSPIVRTLTINKMGSGSGTVGSDPVGIDCGSDCGEAYQIGTEITLTAAPGTASNFAGWSGCDSVDGLVCTVAVNADQAVSATFLPAQQELTITKAGSADGTVTSSPAGIDCPSLCAKDFDEGSSVTLTANPDSVAQLDSWSGCDTTDGNTCTVQMTTAREVTATFGPAQRTLTVTRAGTGAGTVTGSPAGIDCGSDCSETYDHGTTVQLTPVAGEGSDFTGWTGCASVEGDVCTVNMLGDEDPTATFTIIQRTLTVSKDGNGSGAVQSSPAGITCGSDCSQGYAHDTQVTLTATPATNSVFGGWDGCTSATAECTVTMDDAKNVTATFTLEQRSLTVTKSGSGGGTVSSSPIGIDCGSDCSESYSHGTSVTLTATPNGDSALASWSGCATTSGTTCTVSMTSALEVTATFSADPRTVTVSKIGFGSGSVSSSPAGIECGDACAADFAPGTAITLTAAPGASSEFAGWSGCDSTAGLSCTVTVDSDENVQATFNSTVAPTSSFSPTLEPRNEVTGSFGYLANGGSGLALTRVELWLEGPDANGDFVKVAEVTGAATSGTFNGVTLNEGDGTYSAKIVAFNEAGNSAESDADTFLLDTIAPSSSATAAATSNVNQFVVSWSTTHTGVSPEKTELWVRRPGASKAVLVEHNWDAASQGENTFQATASGSYAFYTVAVDDVGNREDVPATPDAVVEVTLCAGYETDDRPHVVGGAGNDTLTGTGADEVICGGAGNDTLKGGSGSDLLLGGDGKDTVTYAERTSKQPIVITVNAGGADDGQAQEGDEVGLGIENVIGGKANDTITGDGQANTLKGGVGNDTIKGGAANDKLYGDKGKDKLDGGTKKDVCKTGETYKGCEIR